MKKNSIVIVLLLIIVLVLVVFILRTKKSGEVSTFDITYRGIDMWHRGDHVILTNWDDVRIYKVENGNSSVVYESDFLNGIRGELCEQCLIIDKVVALDEVVLLKLILSERHSPEIYFKIDLTKDQLVEERIEKGEYILISGSE